MESISGTSPSHQSLTDLGRWVHLFEEDNAQGALYIRDSGDIPLSRRPRDGFEFHAGGSVTLLRPEADDRLGGHRARWEKRGDGLVVHTPDGELAGTLESPTRLRVTKSR